MKNGKEEAVHLFVEDYTKTLGKSNMDSFMFCQYMLINIQVGVMKFVEKMGVEKANIDRTFKDYKQQIAAVSTGEKAAEYIEELIRQAIRMRNERLGKKHSSLITEAKEFIVKNYQEETLSLSDVADQVGLSSSHFSTTFKQETGKSFVEFLTSVRMDKAKEMLCFTDMKASQISYEVGYKDPHYFSYLFKKRKDVLRVNIDQGGCNEKICERIYCSISEVLNRKKLKWLRMVVIIPALVGIITLLVIMINFNESYNEAVKNVSVASKFNFSFSEDMDYKMYRIVIGAESFDAMKPYEEIKEAKELVKELNKNAVTDESKLRTRQIGKLLDNLKISIEEIEHSDLKNDYMENNQRLRLNVNVFTEIIKEKVSEYIYYEIGNMESMRVKLEKEIMHTITITLIAVLFCL